MSRIEDEPPLDIISKIILIICAIVFIFGLYVWIDHLIVEKPPKVEYGIREDSYVRQTNIHHYPQFTILASLAHLYPKDMRDTLTCESTWRHYNSDGTILRGKAGEYGVAQFMWTTFEQYKKEAGRPELSIYVAEDQLWLMEWMFENDLKSHWTCYRNLYN